MSELREVDGREAASAQPRAQAGPAAQKEAIALCPWRPAGPQEGLPAAAVVAGQAPSSRPGTERRRQLGQPSPPACASSRVAANSVQAWRSANSGAEA